MVNYSLKIKFTNKSIAYGVLNRLITYYRNTGRDLPSCKVVGGTLLTSDVPLSNLEKAIEKMRLNNRRKPKIKPIGS